MKHILTTILVIVGFVSFAGKPETNDVAGYKNVEDIGHKYTLETYIQVSPPSVQVYYYTKKYCEQYNVPETVAFGIAKLETSYLGPNLNSYNPEQTSYANAYGTYQLLLSTARDMYEGNRNELTPEMLLSDVRLNTQLGIKYLRYLHDIYGNWKIVCGYYNTGYPKINQYAIDATKYINHQ